MGEEMIEAVVARYLKSIPEVSQKVYPLGAPENATLPFLVYISDGATEDDSLSGWIGSFNSEMEVNVLHSSYKAMKRLTAQVVSKLKTVTEVSLTISEEAPEVYESQIQAYRKAIHIKIMY